MQPDVLKQLQQEEAPDVFCLQETKLQKQDTQKTGRGLQLPGWHMHWSCSQKPARLGYAVRLISRHGKGWLLWQLEPWQASPALLPSAGDSLIEPVRASGACTGHCTALKI